MSRVAWVDVFATGPMTGNPLAVVLDGEGWDDARMQALAAELGISETVVVLPPEEGGDARLRIFTPARELPVAGHPLVGAAWVLHAAGVIEGRAVLETGAGPREVRVRGAVATADMGVAEAGAEADAAEAAAAAGLPAPGGPARIWGVGVPQLMLPAPDAAALRDAVPDHDRLVALAGRDGWAGVSVYATAPDPEARPVVEVRHFAPAIGVPEDPVTGSAAAALGARLAAEGLAGDGGDLSLVVRQRTASGRGGEVAVRVTADPAGGPGRVQVGGRVEPLIEGRILDNRPPAEGPGGG
ncbi:MAG: PhzF family phenazine biosynthesis protein [Thermoleophilia bacterium]